MVRVRAELLPILALFAVYGCAGDLPPQTYDLGPADPRQDALLGTVGAEAGAQPSPPPRDGGSSTRDGSAMQMSDAAPEPCAPFSRVGTCAICNAEGMPEMPESDGTCPAIECPESRFYERVEMNGEAICFLNERTGGIDADCAEVGRCATQDERCGAPSRQEVSRAAANPCMGMVGCRDQEPPTVQQLELGDPCNEFGRCDAGGECTVPVECAAFDRDIAREFCDGARGGNSYCEFFVHRRDDMPFSCETFCMDHGATCAGAWNDAGGGCGRDREIDCSAELREYICQCRVN